MIQKTALWIIIAISSTSNLYCMKNESPSQDILIKGISLGDAKWVRNALTFMQHSPSPRSNVNKLDKGGFAPIHRACLQQNHEIVTALIEASAEVNIESNPERLTPLHIATKNNDLSIVTLLLCNGARIYAKDRSNKTALDYAKEQGFAVIEATIFRTATQQRLDALLFQAITTQRPLDICTLIKKGAQCNTRDIRGNTPLHYAVGTDYDGIPEILLANHAIPNIQNNDGNTALHMAIESGNLRATQLFLQHGAKITIENNAGTTPLKLAQKTSPTLYALLKRHSGPRTAQR